MPQASIILNDIEQRLHLVKNRQNGVDLLSNTLIFCTSILVSAIILVIVETLFDFSSTIRTIIVVSFALVFLSLCSWMVIRLFLRLIGVLSSGTNETIAKQVGMFFPSIQDRLINALQLAKNISSDSVIYSAELIDESLKDFIVEIETIDFTQSVSTVHIPKKRTRMILSVGITILIAFIFPASISGAAYRLIHCTREFVPPPKYSFEVSPGNKEIVKGENVDIQVKVISLLPAFTPQSKDFTILRQQEGQDNYDEVNVKPDSSGIYK